MIAGAFDLMIGMTLMMLIVLLVRRPVAEWFGAGWAYALWLLPLLPLLRPLLPPLDLLTPEVAAFPQSYTILIPAAGELAAAGAEPASGGQWVELTLALWLGGLGIFGFWQHAVYSAFMLSLGRNARPSKPPEHGGVPVVESQAVDGPLAVGVLRPRIVVPLDFLTRYSPAERSLALEHELIHHRRRDIWWNLAALAVLALNWFNPVAWIAFRAFRTDQELACDAAVAANISTCGLHDYARAMVKSASRPGEIAACPLNTADQLKRRLKMMGRHRSSRGRAVGGGTVLATLLASGLVLSSPGLAREEADFAGEPVIVDPAGEEAGRMIPARDIARLQDKCGSGSLEIVVRYRSYGGSEPRAVRCAGMEVADPEVREIVAEAAAAAQARGRAAETRARATEARIRAAERRAARRERSLAHRERRLALTEGERERAEAARERAEAARERAEARAEAGTARLEALEARREAAAARAEALAEAQEARHQAQLARKAAAVQRAEAHAQAAIARRQAQEAREQAHEARRQAAIARQQALVARAQARADVHAARATHLALARARPLDPTILRAAAREATRAGARVRMVKKPFTEAEQEALEREMERVEREVGRAGEALERQMEQLDRDLERIEINL